MLNSKFIKIALIGLIVLSASPISADVIPSESVTSDTNKSSKSSEVNSTTQERSNALAQSAVVSGVAMVTTESEFWAAIFDQSVTTILLANDIVANPSNRLSGSGNSAGAVKRNLTIDGQGHNLSYDTKAYGTQILYAGTSGINITFQNMSMGSKAYPNNNYYGIFTIQQTNVTLNVKDFTYYAENGAQPFFADGNAGSTLNFYGANTFTANGTSYGGEFIERFKTTNFKADSNTNVVQDTPTSLAAIYSDGTAIVNLESNARLSINSTKDAFVYGSTTINLQDNAYLGYENKKGSNYKSDNAILTYPGTGTTTINGGVNSEVDFISNDSSMDVSNTQINSNGMKAVFVANNLGNVASKNNLIIKRIDTSSDIYDLNTLSLAGVQSQPVSNIGSNTTLTISPATYGSGKSFLFIAQPTALSAKFVPQVGSNLSNLNGTITTSQDAIRTIKVSNSRLYTDGNVNSVASQNLIESAPITPKVVNDDSPTLLTSNILGGQISYIYYNVQSVKQFTGYTLKSAWVEATAVQTKYSEVTFPDSPITFNQPIPGSFAMSPAYTVKNSGNVPLNIKPTSVSDTNANVALVESLFEPNKQQVSLSLHGTSKTDSHDWNFKNLDANTLTINPYFTDSNYINYNIKGNYSGPLIGIQNVKYAVTFGWFQ
ncbi:exported hypothetical protein [Pseudolactococcus piscium]|nr:exported hypothetical protein [Lactococcus piscium]